MHLSMAVKDGATLGITMGKGRSPAWAGSRRNVLSLLLHQDGLRRIGLQLWLTINVFLIIQPGCKTKNEVT